MTATLVLEDGTTCAGESFGARGATVGELVFCTGMTGYQETLTDPSYHRQIVLATAPHIGNTGWTAEDDESGRVWAAGYVVRDPARHPSSWRARSRLDDELARQGVVGVRGVDTRAITRRIRDRGSMRAGVFSGPVDVATALATVRASAPMTGANLTGDVSPRRPAVLPAFGATRFRVAVLDLGCKRNLVRQLRRRGVEVHLLPGTAGPAEPLDRGVDGVLVSNGPGDPASAGHLVEFVRGVLRAEVPLFGVCLGHQLLGQALGMSTYKMRYGHRGSNIPVVDTATGRVAITAHNHGFAVAGAPDERFDTAFGAARVTHFCPNDATVEGVRCLDVPAFGVQYHPEASAGPHDAESLFDEFTSLLGVRR
ncbi:glutamine-hydrolyzing carbamoyl-phosphate synthase small subunit [Actinosynnema sp. CS-041913]|uniref:glutamine-hydrolyzing carbamoyl-phosphate synthase small subunit n=1 Tax=Actinosynnema sp. CS-041913 TaxID=3239917 RepID=UPI003D8DC186